MTPPVALFGALPAEPEPIRLGGTDRLWQRWSQWLSLSRHLFADASPGEHRCWRLIAAPGIFDDTPTAGVWRLSRSQTGTPLPAALIAGQTPAPGDPWFDAASLLLDRAIDANWTANRVKRAIPDLPGFAPAPPSTAAVFWLDDWEVHELRFTDIHDLAGNGFARMLAPRPVVEEG
ncbi:hypothetical protein QKW60_14130 [Defluviimonas aestuarii]|uniref:hypothetical protein n=1 Tax=Albidovulum aestuarii TaxID=1130726 RepID=UPI00249BDA0F|nr:hypothetical protein [Defluviimonas aestuarii]MDI3337552.1 hypothetical protein [Defluviimonas aestuarii]